MQAGQHVAQKKKRLRAIDSRLRKAHHALIIEDDEPEQIIPQEPAVAINQHWLAPVGREAFKSQGTYSSQENTLDDDDSDEDIFADIIQHESET